MVLESFFSFLLLLSVPPWEWPLSLYCPACPVWDSLCLTGGARARLGGGVELWLKLPQCFIILCQSDPTAHIPTTSFILEQWIFFKDVGWWMGVCVLLSLNHLLTFKLAMWSRWSPGLLIIQENVSARRLEDKEITAWTLLLRSLSSQKFDANLCHFLTQSTHTYTWPCQHPHQMLRGWFEWSKKMRWNSNGNDRGWAYRGTRREKKREKRWNGRGVPHIKSLFTGLEN